MINPKDHYWSRDDGAIYASNSQTIVTDGDAAFVAWLAAGNRATRWPIDGDGNQTVAALQDVLNAYGLFVDLAAYTMARRDALLDLGFEFRGVMYQSRVTDRENILGASVLASMAIAAGAQPGDFQWAGEAVDFEWIALDNSMVKMDAQTVIALGATQAARKRELIFLARLIKDEIDAGTITTTAQIDAAFA